MVFHLPYYPVICECQVKENPVRKKNKRLQKSLLTHVRPMFSFSTPPLKSTVIFYVSCREGTCSSDRLAGSVMTCLQTMLTYMLETINEVDRTYHFSINYSHPMIWVKVFKSGPSKICERQLLKNLK